MIGFLVFCGIILIVAIIILNWYIAEKFQNIASEKGYDDRAYFWWCFFMGSVGYFMVCALPDRGCEDKLESVRVELGKITPNNTVPSDSWKCKKCGKINKNYCGTCGCGNTKE